MKLKLEAPNCSTELIWKWGEKVISKGTEGASFHPKTILKLAEMLTLWHR